MIGGAQRPFRILALLAGCVMALTSCSWMSGPDQHVVVVGDSITNLIKGQLKKDLGDKYGFSVEAMNGKTSTDMAPVAAKLARSKGSETDQVIINLGTNDVLQQKRPENAIRSITEIAGMFPDARCIHIATINTQIVSFEILDVKRQIEQVNEGILKLAKSDPRISIIDWNAIVSAQIKKYGTAKRMTSDSVHPTKFGQKLLVEAYGKALDDCPRK